MAEFLFEKDSTLAFGLAIFLVENCLWALIIEMGLKRTKPRELD